MRFNNALKSLTETDNGVVSMIQDSVTGRTYQVKSKYVFGCDGARSQVVREIGLPLLKKPGQGLALNVLVKTDLSHLVKTRRGNLVSQALTRTQMVNLRCFVFHTDIHSTGLFNLIVSILDGAIWVL